MSKPGKGRRGAGLAALLAAVVGLGVFASVASATQYQRPFVETFGSAEQPSFSNPELLAVNSTTGEVLVADSLAGGAGAIRRFHPDGPPAPFAALGGNPIDGKAGPGGKPCAEEPSSCDQTPQNELEPQGQMAVDPTNGNIYVTQALAGVVSIFSSEGRYLGQLTAAGTKKFDGPCGVLIDSAGAVYVAVDRRISKYVAAGAIPVNADNTANFKVEYEGACKMAFAGGPSAGSIFIVAIGGNPGPHLLKVNKETGALTEFAKGPSGLLTVDPTSGNPLVGVPGQIIQGGEFEAVEYDGSGATAGPELSRVVVEGHGLRISDIAANGAGDIYAVMVNYPNVLVYGEPAVVPTVTVDPATEITGSEATLSGTVAPEGIAITECFFEYGPPFPKEDWYQWKNSVPCEESVPTDSSEHAVHARVSGLTPNGSKYGFRLVARNANGAQRTAAESLRTALTAATAPATVTGLQSATLNGTVRPEGLQYTHCYFEWGLTSSEDYEHTAPCDPAPAMIPTDFDPHAVSAPLGELQEATTYRYRLVATNSAGTIAGAEMTFETFGMPKIVELRAGNADDDSATLEARIDPSGFDTSYRFEWGPTASYGKVVPASFTPIGSGTEPIRVSAEISGLPAASTYHYRVVASGPGGTTESDDQVVETLNSCGLPDGRCFELVSRRDAGPVAFPGMIGETLEIDFQAAPKGPGGLAYVVESGYPDATKGYEVLYRGTRGPSGWTSTQLSTPIVDRNESTSPSSLSGHTKWLSDDLACGFAESTQPLTADPGPRWLYERGGSNLYRLDPDGSYTAVTDTAPENVGVGGGYQVAGASQDCGKVLFSTNYLYPGILGEGSTRLYEWEEGTLRNAGVIPGPSGEVVAAASAAGLNGVSMDGSRVFFTANRRASSNPAEIGEPGIFVREDDSVRDISLSETSTPSENASYLWATADGSHVFFMANAGLTEDSSPSGTDLYRYDLESDELTNLSVNPRAGGAQVSGLLGASEDGSHAYFAARGQFFPGQGNTLAENQSNNTYSVYSAKNGTVSFVGTVSAQQLVFDVVAIDPDGWGGWSSRVSPDGRYLLFQSTEQVTDYDSSGGWAAYLYDAEGGSQATVCVSCRPDGAPPIAPDRRPVGALKQNITKLTALRSLVVRNGRPQVYFSSRDALAPGAEEDRVNVYEWSHGQVFLLARERPEIVGVDPGFVGASADGSDVYLYSPEELSWEDPDERLSVYTARVGGGFPEPAPGPTPCDPDVEGSCQGASQGATATAPGAASATFGGPGNVKQAQKKKQKKRKSAKKRGAKKKGQHGKQKRKRAGANRRAGK